MLATVDMLSPQLQFSVMVGWEVSFCQENLRKHESQKWRAVCLLTGPEQVLTEEWGGFISRRYVEE